MNAYAFLSDLIPLYPVYALLFSDSGLSTAEISSLFAIWSITGLVLEVPSGVLADVVSRRLLVTVAPLLSGAGFAAWTVLPSYPAFAAGFVLWGAQGALRSGALEALVFDELEHEGEAHRYAHVMGRAVAVAAIAQCAAMGLAAPLLALDGFSALGVASVAACVAAAAVAATLPEHRRRAATDDDAPPGGGLTTLRSAIAEVRGSPALRTLLPLLAVVSALWGALDEYLPLLAIEAGATTATVPLLGVLIYAAMAAGGALAGRAARLSPAGTALLLAAAAVALGAGAGSGVPAGFVLIALSFSAQSALEVLLDARVQDAIEGGARATVTSLAGLATEVLTIVVFAGYAAGSATASHAAIVTACAVVALVLAPLPLRRRRA